MKLPPGITYHPRETRLISDEDPAIIGINKGARYLGNDSYEVKPRTFANAIQSYLKGSWEEFHRLHRLRPGVLGSADCVYSGEDALRLWDIGTGEDRRSFPMRGVNAVAFALTAAPSPARALMAPSS